MSTRQAAVKRYVVTLSAEERERLEALIRTGKHSARKLLRARILLSADASEAGEALTDSQIAVGLRTSPVTVARVRQQLVEEGVDGVLTPKRSPNSARRRIFDGASEAKLIALACSTPPEGFARWTLQLLESKVVELNIVARASDNTIGRTLKKTFMWTAIGWQASRQGSQIWSGKLPFWIQQGKGAKFIVSRHVTG